LELIDGEDIEYMTEDDLTSDAEESGSLLEDDAVFARFAKMMHEPPNETRLHIQFLVDSHENQTEIGGGMVKADGVSYYAMMDAEKVTLDSVEELAKAEITVDNIEEALHEASRQMHNLVKSTSFRRSKLRHQRTLVDELLSDIDSTLQIDRFKMYVRPTEFFVPDTSNENHSMIGYSCNDTVSGFSVEPIRIETLNSFALMGGTRITSDRQVVYPSNSGVCVVAEIDDHVRDFYSLPCNVIWIPVAFPITNHKTSTPGFRAHFEE
ncbi:hypothetical protein KBD20_04455, partial [Candidatus Saccharibacteria bacterium]|nr:hypothetical protein [Candidatus Saccharibacteria bacterium]